jgi:hypothetical protein
MCAQEFAVIWGSFGVVGGLEEEGEFCFVEDVGGCFGFESALVVDGGVLVGFAFFDGVEFGGEEVFCVGGGFVEVGEVDGGAGFGVGEFSLLGCFEEAFGCVGLVAADGVDEYGAFGVVGHVCHWVSPCGGLLCDRLSVVVGAGFGVG